MTKVDKLFAYNKENQQLCTTNNNNKNTTMIFKRKIYNKMLHWKEEQHGTTALPLLAMFIFGGETIRGFVFAILLGVIVGTYSTIFIASPIAYDIQQKQAKKAQK